MIRIEEGTMTVGDLIELLKGHEDKVIELHSYDHMIDEDVIVAFTKEDVVIKEDRITIKG
jgi:hypothetical protein